MEKNYQFYQREVTKHSIVALAISTDLSIFANSDYGLIPTNVKFRVSKKIFSNTTISLIDSQPATDKFLQTIGWPVDFLDDRLFRRTFFTQ